VLVPLGKNKQLAGVVVRVVEPPDVAPGLSKTLKEVVEVLDDRPILPPQAVNLLYWIADYYACEPGDVLRAMLPANLKLTSETVVYPMDAGTEDLFQLPAWPDLKPREQLVLQLLARKGKQSVRDVGKLLGSKGPADLLKRLEERKLVRLAEESLEAYRPQLRWMLGLAPELDADAPAVESLIQELNRAPRQLAVLDYIRDRYRKRLLPVSESEALQAVGATPAVVKALAQRGVVVRWEEPVSRIGTAPLTTLPLPPLTGAQARALAEIQAAVGTRPRKPVLLFGITGSGKTRLYIELIRQTLDENRQALYLLPEIGLTKQIIDRVRGAFGEQVGVYHSRFSDNERVEIWQKVLSGEYTVVIGVRSALLLPFANMGLIVVDEEHDPTYKQSDMAPRYQARDTAVYYGHQLGIPVVLGSATPSVESLTNALEGRYTLVRLNERATQVLLPTIECIDLKQEIAAKTSHGLFSEPLIEGLRQTVAAGEQAIVFNQRRGYATWLQCGNCGHVPHCQFCDISLTYHKTENALKCHYCGYTESHTTHCPSCKHNTLGKLGIGTERAEEQLNELLPTARILRMDSDSTRGRHGHQQILNRFERHEYDILVGTQMVAKGLDFDKVTFVGVVLADNLLNMPYFRAHEHACQLLTQLSGRAGRQHRRGRVLIQTYTPDHPVVQLLTQPYDEAYQWIKLAREWPNYPPFTRLMRLELHHPDKQKLETEAQRLTVLLVHAFGAQVVGPEYPAVGRVSGLYRLHWLFKIPKTANFRQARETLKTIAFDTRDKFTDRDFRLFVDIDPR
jgi:primosomal protein N' (replication factor Y)